MGSIIKDIDITGLLERELIELDTQKIGLAHTGKTILVTGGAGSIGSELIRQICIFVPHKIVVLDQGETPLHQLILELNDEFSGIDIEYILGDVSDRARVEKIFLKYRIDIVYHIAAYKHVPILERNPEEGVRVNVLGTKNVAELASEYHVERFVMVSTDKAVNPINIMGATKRVAERLVQVLQRKKENKTQFIITRFGNVLASNGSVLFRFREQIDRGGPITITHPEATRYFMTISESCKLLLQVGAMGNGGEICIFDMGEPIKIEDLAKKMCQLYGLEGGKDIEFVFTGLRAGDKLYEQLWSEDAEMTTSCHHKILIYRDSKFDCNQFYVKVEQLIALYKEGESKEIVNLLKEMLPEFKSENNGVSRL